MGPSAERLGIPRVGKWALRVDDTPRHAGPAFTGASGLNCVARAVFRAIKLSGSNPKMPPENVGICALAGVTVLQSHLHSRLTSCQALERPQQSSELTPLPKADAGMATKQAVESFDAHGQLPGPGICISIIIGASLQMSTHQ